MKRQSKPFAVEIKRSRRAPLPSPSSKAGLLAGGRVDPDEARFLDKGARPAFDAELAVPVFLQSDKAVRRPVAKASPQEFFKDSDQVFASARPPLTDDARSFEERARPRILPSLIDSADAEPGPQAKPARKSRGGRAVSEVGSKETRAERKQIGQPAPLFAAEAATVSRQQNGALQRPEKARRPNPVANRSGVTNNELSNRDAGKPATGVLAAPTFAADAPRDDRPRTSPARGLAKRGRHDAADLPLGQRWKRRLHPRAW